MRFLARSLAGLFLTALAVGMAVYGGWRLVDAWQLRQAQAPAAPRLAERVYAVAVLEPRPTTLRPELTAFGRVASARRLELRAALPGRLVELSPAFLDGGEVQAGDLLARIDPAPAESDLARARIALADAQAELSESRRAETLAARDLEASREQRRLRARALSRQEDLRDRGVGTEAATEAAELALSAARQQVIAREQAQAEAAARAAAARISLRRAELAVKDAERALADTELRAPFDGLVTEVQAVAGRRVSENEKLGALIDPGRLEVAFRVSNGEYARLLDGAGRLPEHAAAVRLEQGETDAALPARLVRAGASAGEGGAGRLLYARLTETAGARLREGDFVTVTVAEPALEGVARLPAAAATEDGRVLVVQENDRLAERALRILRRQGDMLVVDDPPSLPVVAVRKPQLGPGLKVETLPARSAGAEAGAPLARSAPPEGDGRGPEIGGDGGGADMARARGAGDLIRLSEGRRARLTEAVRGDEGLSERARARMLAWLAAPRAPREVVERMEARAGAAPSDG